MDVLHNSSRKSSFADISCGHADFGFHVQQHFFGSCHGKNPSDGEGGVVKSKVSQLIKSQGLLINNAPAFYAVAKQHLTKGSVNRDGTCEHYRRTFILVRSDEIDRDSTVRKERAKAVTVEGTRKLHCVIGTKPGYVTGLRKI